MEKASLQPRERTFCGYNPQGGFRRVPFAGIINKKAAPA